MQKNLFSLLLLLLGTSLFSQNVGIGTATPDASAKLEVFSNNSGVLFPRLTTAQRDAIASPAVGLLIYNTDNNCYEFWSGSMWVSMCQTCTGSPPPPNISGASEICFGDNYTYTGSGAPAGAIYLWTKPDGSLFTGNPLQIINASASDTGWYYLKYYIDGCYSLTDSLHVTESQSQFIRKTDFPGTARAVWYSAYFTLGSKVYIVGGWIDNTTNINDCWSYDMATDTWTPCANYPLAHISHAVGIAPGNGKGYVVGGRSTPSGVYINNVYEYDPIANTWNTATAFPRTIGSTIRSSVDVVGLGLPCGSSNTLYKYQTLTNTWTATATYPTGGDPADGSFRFIFEDGTYVYIGGGHSNCPCCTPKYFELKRYVKSTGGGWQNLAPVPAAAHPIIPNPVVIGNKAYAVGSDFAIWTYDIPSNTWTRNCSLPPGFQPGVSAKYNNSLFLFDLNNKSVYEYQP